jgi:hypothetical protein
MHAEVGKDPLPAVLCAALDWLSVVERSSLFRYVWSLRYTHYSSDGIGNASCGEVVGGSNEIRDAVEEEEAFPPIDSEGTGEGKPSAPAAFDIVAVALVWHRLLCDLLTGKAKLGTLGGVDETHSSTTSTKIGSMTSMTFLEQHHHPREIKNFGDILLEDNEIELFATTSVGLDINLLLEGDERQFESVFRLVPATSTSFVPKTLNELTAAGVSPESQEIPVLKHFQALCRISEVWNRWFIFYPNHFGSLPDTYSLGIEFSYMQATNRSAGVVVKLKEVALHWKHVRQLYLKHSVVDCILQHSKNHLPEAYWSSCVKPLLEALIRLHSSIKENGNWNNQEVSLLEQCWTDAGRLDAKLLRIPHSIFAALIENAKLLQWLRSVQDDELFVSSIEIARSLQEMGAPRELWNRAANRIDDKYFAMISNVRSYLYSYLYNSGEIMSSFDEFLTIFSELNPDKTQQIIENMAVCSSVCTALQQIIGIKSKTGAGANVQIIDQLYALDSKSTWCCTNTGRAASAVAISSSKAESPKEEEPHVSGGERRLFLQYQVSYPLYLFC